MTLSKRSPKKASGKLLFVPSKVDIRSILNSIGHADKYIYDHIDKYHYILHKIFEGKIYAFGESSYTSLNFDTLVEVMGAKYVRPRLDELIEWGIIETDNHYIKGEKSKGYRITHAYQSKVIGMDITKEAFEAKLERITARNVATYTKPANYLYKCLQQLKINKELAIPFIDNKLQVSVNTLETIVSNSISYLEVLKKYNELACKKYLYSLMPILSEKFKALPTEYQLDTANILLQKHLIDTYNLDLISIEKIANKEFEVHQPDIQSRIFTVLTSLSRELRNFLYYKSETLTNIDIKNSQPFIFNMVLKDHYKGKKLSADVTNYINLTSTGKFYEYMMNLLDVPAEKRDCFKKDFFGKTFYCTEHYAKRTNEGQVFEVEFPNVVNVMNQYKQIEKSFLPVMMQRKEAEIILQKIVLKLAAKRIWCNTIHDSVVVRSQDAETVKAIMLKTFADEYSLTPTVEAKELIPNEPAQIEANTAVLTIAMPEETIDTKKEIAINGEAEMKPKYDFSAGLEDLDELLLIELKRLEHAA